MLVACGGEGASLTTGAGGAAHAPPPAPVAETCAIRLPPRAPDAPPALAAPSASTFIAPRSTLVVDAELPLGGLRQAIEAKVPRRIAEDRDHDLGVAGRLEYTVDRGPFAVHVENDTIVVESMLQGRAQACAKGRCYAGCAPEARATARIPLRLGADYKLRTSEVRIDVTRGCQVRALGGFVTIDVTPMLRGVLAAQSRSVQASIDRELPDFKPQATRLWAELEKPRELPLGMCVVLAPEEITQGPASGTVQVARLRFGLLARPEVRVKCAGAAASSGPGGGAAPPPSKRPLPPLRDDPALPPLGDVHLAIALGEDAPARAVERAGEVVDFGGRRARVSRVTGSVGAGLLVDLSGEVCGDVGLGATGAAWDEQQSLRLTGVAPLAGEVERLAVAPLDPVPLARAVEHSSMALPIALGALPAMLPGLASSMSDATVTVAATVASARPGSAGLRGNDVIAVALLRGSVTLRVK